MSNYPTKKLSSKRYRQEQADSCERNFETLCGKNRIEFIRLDKNKEAREKFLKYPHGKSPDYLCVKDGQSIFVEVKTHTLLTNEARNKAMTQTIQAKRAAGLSGPIIFDPFDPVSELKVPFEGYLRNASKKFKNIKDEYDFPRILLLDGTQILEHDIFNIFLGKLLDVDRSEYVKKHTGLLDTTGSNVSAIVYQATDLNVYRGIENPRKKIPLSEENFRRFFEIPHV